MNTNEIMAQTLAEVQKQLQAIHTRLNAPSTQNVRNVEPAHTTIVACLPTRRCDAISASELWKRFKVKGGLVKRASFDVTLSKMTPYSDRVSGCGVRISDHAPYRHYYFGF